MKIFIGYDDKETVAFHVLSHSILSRSSIPVEITPLNRRNLVEIFDRPRGELESTDFSISRFMVPYLCNYEGWAVFMDCDMLCQVDIAWLAQYMTPVQEHRYAVQCVKHDYEPKEKTKFLGAKQTQYSRKNWSSLMIFNNQLCKTLTPEYVHFGTGLNLHQMVWADRIGELPREWNYLVGEENQMGPPKIIHYTKGTPCFSEYAQSEMADLWHQERKAMLSPTASAG